MNHFYDSNYSFLVSFFFLPFFSFFSSICLSSEFCRERKVPPTRKLFLTKPYIVAQSLSESLKRRPVNPHGIIQQLQGRDFRTYMCVFSPAKNYFKEIGEFKHLVSFLF